MKLNFVDLNGKQITTSLSEIMDMTVISDESNEDVKSNFTISIKDKEGNELNIADVVDAAKKDPGEIPSAIDVTYEATHSGSNRNNSIYHSDSMKKDTKTWMTPYPKPLLKNHVLESEPMGRVVSAKFHKSNLNPERDCISVTWRVTDQEAIPKFLDGRYKTLSVGASGKSIVCDFCGKEILKDGIVDFCGHWRGESYPVGDKGKTFKVAKWNIRMMEYKEGSVVNSPADDWAQQTEAVIVEEQTDSTKGGQPMANLDTTDSVEVNPLNIVDELLNVHDHSTSSTANNDSTTDEETGDEEDSDEDIQTLTDERDQLKVDIEALRKDNENLSREIETLNDKIAELQLQIVELSTSEDSIKEELNTTIKESKDNRKQSIQLAVMNKDLLVNRIVDYKIFRNEIAEDKIEDHINELKVKSANELNSMLNEILLKKPQRQMASVVSPGIDNPDDKHVVDENKNTGDNNSKDNNEKELTMEDFTDAIVNCITSNKK